MKVKISSNERVDDLQLKGYRIIQNKNNFCFGIDAVLLSGYCKINEDEVVLDLGTGTGIIPILLEGKTKGKHFTGLEIQQESVDMAKRSVVLNNQESKISIIHGDIKEAVNMFPLSSFDVITCNPPYMQSGLKNINSSKAIARHEILCTLEDVIKTTSKLVKVGGRFYMVHRPQRLSEIIYLLKSYKLEPKRVRFVHPYKSKEANMVLVESVRHGKPMMKIEPPLVIYEDNGSYTNEVYQIYGYNEKIRK